MLRQRIGHGFNRRPYVGSANDLESFIAVTDIGERYFLIAGGASMLKKRLQRSAVVANHIHSLVASAYLRRENVEAVRIHVLDTVAMPAPFGQPPGKRHADGAAFVRRRRAAPQTHGLAAIDFNAFVVPAEIIGHNTMPGFVISRRLPAERIAFWCSHTAPIA